MKLQKLTGLAILGCLFLAGCENEMAKPALDPNIAAKEAMAKKLAKYKDFKVSFPEAFDGEFNPNEMEVGPEVGKLAPEIEGQDIDGASFKLSDYRGKVVMLSFYGDW